MRVVIAQVRIDEASMIVKHSGYPLIVKFSFKYG